MNRCESMVTITAERYEQLIRAEQDANLLKCLISAKYDSYRELSRDDLKMLVTMFIGIKED